MNELFTPSHEQDEQLKETPFIERLSEEQRLLGESDGQIKPSGLRRKILNAFAAMFVVAGAEGCSITQEQDGSIHIGSNIRQTHSQPIGISGKELIKIFQIELEKANQYARASSPTRESTTTYEYHADVQGALTPDGVKVRVGQSEQHSNNKYVK
jgi:hypothetical protein